jgi:hypothetical protein
MQFQTTKRNNKPNKILVIRQILENFYTHDIDLYLLFIAFKNAFDSINQKKSYWNQY